MAAYLGLTPARYRSGAVDRTGGITTSGDVLARAMLYEAANALLLTRERRPTALRTWGRALAARALEEAFRVRRARPRYKGAPLDADIQQLLRMHVQPYYNVAADNAIHDAYDGQCGPNVIENKTGITKVLVDFYP